jgi:hypothetical protein
MRIDASGNVGIGTTSPYASLTVDTANGILNIANGNTSGGTKIQAWGATPSDGYLAIEGYTKEYMRLDSSGNVGIGVSSLVTGSSRRILQVSTGSDGGQIAFADSTTEAANPRIFATNKSDLKLASANTGSSTIQFITGTTTPAERMRIDASGNVGIGTSSINEVLVSSGTVRALGATVSNESSTTLSYSSGVGGVEVRGPDTSTRGTLNLYQAASNGSLGQTALHIDASGNVGIGTSSPTQKLHVVGDYIRLVNSADTQNILFKADTARVSIEAPNGTLAFDTASTERMRIDSSGNVGIGVSSPSQPLHVDATGGTTAALFDNNGTNGDVVRVGKNGTDILKIRAEGTADVALDANGGAFIFKEGGAEAMRIDSSGNLLVGTTSAGGSNGITFHSSGYIQPRTNTGIPAIYADREGSDGSIVELRKDGTSVGSIGTVAGDIVIGTGACGIRFHDGTPALQPRNTDGSANNDAIDIGLTGNRFKDLFLSGAAASGTSSNYLRFLHDGGNGIIDNTAGSLVFRRSGSFTESMRLDTSGNLLVGKTSTAAGDGTVIGSNGVSNCTASGTATLILNRQSSNGDCLEFRRQNVKVGSVSVSGTNATFNISSDQRLKQNIADADDAGSKIDAIQVRKFDWITDGSHQDYGMVAQELQGVAPEAVSIPDDPEEMMGVDYSKLVPMLVKEIQSLRARVAQLETEEAA